MKRVVVPSCQSRSPVKLVYCIAYESALSACCLLKSYAITLKCLLK